MQQSARLNSKTGWRKPNLSPLERAAALIHQEVDNMERSAPRATLDRLYDIAVELERIEAHL